MVKILATPESLCMAAGDAIGSPGATARLRIALWSLLTLAQPGERFAMWVSRPGCRRLRLISRNGF